MKIKTLMDFLNKDSVDSLNPQGAISDDDIVSSSREENVVYIENARVEAAAEQAQRSELVCNNARWADGRMGQILIELGKLDEQDIERVTRHQRDKGLYFGEAVVDLNLADNEDILHALSVQFGYTYDRNEKALAKELAIAYAPFDEQAEEFRTIRGQLLSGWLEPGKKTLAIVSPEAGEGRSYVAANLAMAFSQVERSTLLIDANLRSPRQHTIFNFERRTGFSMLLAGRIQLEDLDVLPDQISTFNYLSVLGCGVVPPNPSELLNSSRFALILRELKKYYDVIIIDTPSAEYQSDILAIASAAGSALLVARPGRSRMEKTGKLMTLLSQARAEVVGAVLNQF